MLELSTFYIILIAAIVAVLYSSKEKTYKPAIKRLSDYAIVDKRYLEF